MDVVGIGLANIDLIAHVEDSLIPHYGLIKGTAQKLDPLSFARLRADLPQFDAIPGGCAANTMCGLAATGVPSAFYGRIGGDSFESLYRASFSDYMVRYGVEAGGQESSQCAVLVTPDGERTFAYTDGASWDLNEKDIDIEALENAALIYTEIYMFEFGGGSVAKKVIEAAQAHKVPLAMKVMEQDFGRRYGQKIKSLADAGILHLLTGNHLNLPSVVGAPDMESALEIFKGWTCDVVMTANRDGAYFASRGAVTHYPVSVIAKPKNSTGAGDQFIAGFLTGRLERRSVAECMAHGALCARTILMHDTARPPLVNRHSIRF